LTFKLLRAKDQTRLPCAVPQIFEAQTKNLSPTMLKQNLKPWFHVKTKLF